MPLIFQIAKNAGISFKKGAIDKVTIHQQGDFGAYGIGGEDIQKLA
jgi:hypothetical protein